MRSPYSSTSRHSARDCPKCFDHDPAAYNRDPMIRRLRVLILALLIASAVVAPAVALTFRATVEKVVDGDTIHVRDESGRHFRIRLSGVDAPEKGQAFGERARESLVRLLSAGPVFVDVQSSDRYRRLLGKVTCGGRDVGLGQIVAGFAWFYPWADSISEGDRALYSREERTARSGHLGLWRDPNPIPPWQFRRGERAGNFQANPLPVPRVEANNLGGNSGPIIGNRHSKVYHLPQCPSYNAVTPVNRVFFASPAEAEKAGYRRAGNCP
jgi:micrococcal nuclease